MKKLMLTAVISSVVFFGCSKEEIKKTTSGSQNSDPIPLAIGNYWVYDTYKIDTLGNETILSTNDTAFVDRDTLVGGNTFFIIEGDFYAINTIGKILRSDIHSFYDVNEKITFTNLDLGMIYRRDTIPLSANDFIHSEAWTENNLIEITVPLGTFNSYKRTQKSITTDASYSYGVRLNDSYYKNGIGVVSHQFYYYSSPDHYETRLTAYHLN